MYMHLMVIVLYITHSYGSHVKDIVWALRFKVLRTPGGGHCGLEVIRKTHSHIVCSEARSKKPKGTEKKQTESQTAAHNQRYA